MQACWRLQMRQVLLPAAGPSEEHRSLLAFLLKQSPHILPAPTLFSGHFSIGHVGCAVCVPRHGGKVALHGPERQAFITDAAMQLHAQSLRGPRCVAGWMVLV